MAKRKNCGDCGTKEGQLHILGCDMEGCPFCGNQLILPVRLQKAGDRRFARLAGPLSRPHRRTTRRLGNCSRLALLRLQSWLSPAFPTGAYSYSHGLEWAVEAGDIHDRETLVDWLQADLCYGSGRNEAIFFSETWRCATADDREKLFEVAELAAAFRGTAELALESSQQAAACLVTLRQVWPDRVLDWLSETLCERDVKASLAVVLAVAMARQEVPASLGLSAFLQSYIANLITAGVRLVPLGQTDGQLAIAELERAVDTASRQAEKSTLADLGSAAFMVDLASAAHETQYTRLFRS